MLSVMSNILKTKCGVKGQNSLRLFVCLFGLRLYVPVNNFSVMSGRSHRFLGITSTFWGGEVNVSCSRNSLRERLRTHKVFTKDQCFTLIIISSP